MRDAEEKLKRFQLVMQMLTLQPLHWPAQPLMIQSRVADQRDVLGLPH